MYSFTDSILYAWNQRECRINRSPERASWERQNYTGLKLYSGKTTELLYLWHKSVCVATPVILSACDWKTGRHVKRRMYSWYAWKRDWRLTRADTQRYCKRGKTYTSPGTPAQPHLQGSFRWPKGMRPLGTKLAPAYKRCMRSWGTGSMRG